MKKCRKENSMGRTINKKGMSLIEVLVAISLITTATLILSGAITSIVRQMSEASRIKTLSNQASSILAKDAFTSEEQAYVHVYPQSQIRLILEHGSPIERNGSLNIVKMDYEDDYVALQTFVPDVDVNAPGPGGVCANLNDNAKEACHLQKEMDKVNAMLITGTSNTVREKINNDMGIKVPFYDLHDKDLDNDLNRSYLIHTLYMDTWKSFTRGNGTSKSIEPYFLNPVSSPGIVFAGESTAYKKQDVDKTIYYIFNEDNLSWYESNTGISLRQFEDNPSEWAAFKKDLIDGRLTGWTKLRNTK